MDTAKRRLDSARNLAITLLVAPLLFACAQLPPSETPAPSAVNGYLITHAEIEDSGARNGWEAVRRNVNHLRFAEDAEGDVAWVGAMRGNPSLVAEDALLLVIDGTPMLETTYLQEIPARTIAYIEILSGQRGTARYGAAGGSGVIAVRTFSPKRGIAQRR